ncbi:MAG: hypothetical protein COZ17_10055 [Flavobacteriaceae bacterium CG_4_10_14_3_um_filter_33_47]|nr:MAG: hypothetical protein COZ17_10055 [Flavobacteriaceae bacterium CG_4_10_14_3_um_filter_33_47]PJB20437.1 MAG: hypothetical protein CO117_00885 [Flavobacteriaceae bacterium CG_4_9_14_3_um_filter_33_16]
MYKNKAFIILFLLLIISIPADAQCAMCRAVLENEEGQGAAEGINNGIVYLMAIPYILIAGIGFIIYKKFFSQKKQ